MDYFIDNLQNAANLSTLEKDYCNFILSGYTKIEEPDQEKIGTLTLFCETTRDAKERSKALTKIEAEKSKPTINDIKNTIGLNTITNPMLQNETRNKLLKQAKKSIRQKFEKFDRELFY